MRRKRFSPEHIIRILKDAEAGLKIIDICRKYGISDQSFYNWRNKYSGMEISNVQRLNPLTDESRKLKRLVAYIRLLEKTSNA